MSAHLTPACDWKPDLARFTGPLYRRLADAIAAAVAEGVLPSGQRLPTHRELAERLGVTLRTVTRAYGETAERGITTGTIGRGTFVASRDAASATLPSDMPDRAGTIDLALNALPIGPHANLFRRGLATLAAADDIEQVLTYMPPEGAWRHREAGASWAAERGMRTSPGGVTLCCGTQHALLVSLLHLAEPGDTVLTETLNYPGVRRLATTLRLHLRGVTCDGYGMVPEALDEVCCRGRPAAVVLTPSGHNPTTATMPPARRAAIAEVLSRHDVPFIEDDICGHVLVEAPRPLSCDLPALGYYICGTSKCLAPGLRVGYLLSPPDMGRVLAGIVHATTWSVSGFAAGLASHWIGNGTARRLVSWHRKESARRAALLADGLPGMTLRSTPGLYHAWLELPEAWRAINFASQLASAGVHVSPADVFAVEDAEAPRAVRVSLGNPISDGRLSRAARIMADFLARSPSDVFSDRLV